MLHATPPKLLDLGLVIGLGILYPLVHTANGWVFSFAEISPNIGLIYLPAFLRLLNVLVLGKFKGTLAGLLGGLILLAADTEHPLPLAVVNMLCSSAGPLVAVLLFEHWRQRPVNLVSLADLGMVTVIYCVANALLHHFAWALVAPHMLGAPGQVLGMVLGDLVGALFGAYLLKWSAERLGISQPR